MSNKVVNAVAVVSKDVPYRGPLGTRCALLHGLYVHPDWQHSGIGQGLQHAVMDRAKARGADGLLVKAQRISMNYFMSLGYAHWRSPELRYPHLCWTAI
ncbi:MAG: GNAT family N-acetyltransferase [bacterium]